MEFHQRGNAGIRIARIVDHIAAHGGIRFHIDADAPEVSGRRVRVTNGPLVALEASVVEIKNRVQVIVSFEWMARSVAISLDATDVETLR